MLYLDSSALAKRYFRERGSKQLQARLNRGDRVFTSELTYAEVLHVIARKYHDKDIDRVTFIRIRGVFLADWSDFLNRLEVNSATTMTSLQSLLERFRLKGADAIQLSAAMWLRDTLIVGARPPGDDATLEFGVTDTKLAAVAAECGLSVFNPELAP